MRPLGPANSLIPLPSEEQAHGAGGRTPAHRPRGSNHLRFRVGSAPRTGPGNMLEREPHNLPVCRLCVSTLVARSRSALTLPSISRLAISSPALARSPPRRSRAETAGTQASKPADAAEVGLFKGTMEALEQVSIEKGCNIEFQHG